MKKTLSLALAFLLAVSCLCAGNAVYAADAKKCVTVSVSGKQYNNVAQGVIADINNARSQKGYGALTPDKVLTEAAQLRAAEIMVSCDEDDQLRPNGDAVSTVFANGNTNKATMFYADTAVSSENVYNFIAQLAVDYDNIASNLNSIGLAVFKHNSTVAVYSVFSLDSSVEPFTDDMTADYKQSVTVAAAQIKAADSDFFQSKNKKHYTFKTYLYGNLSGERFEIPAAQLTYSSSNTKRLKIKDNRGFPKQQGKINIIAKNKSGTVIAKTEGTVKVESAKIVIASAKSTKKGKLTVKWQKNVSNAAGYQVQYSTDKKFKKGVKTVTVKGKKNVSKTISKLKSKKTYYVRVRAYIDQGYGEKLYTPWGKAKSIKIK